MPPYKYATGYKILVVAQGRFWLNQFWISPILYHQLTRQHVPVFLWVGVDPELD